MNNIPKNSPTLTATVPSLATTSPATTTTLYSVTDIGVLGTDSKGNSSSYATGINNKEQVVGYSTTADGDRAFLWSSTKGLQNLGVLETDVNVSPNSRAFDINDLGQVVGVSTDKPPSYSPGQRPFIWDSTKGIQDLGVLGDNVYNTVPAATAINNLGQEVGYSSFSSTRPAGYRPVLWDSTTGIQKLGDFSPDFPYNSLYNGYAYGINDLGQVVGSTPKNNSASAFLWDSTKGLQDLGISGAATDINNKSQIVGFENPSNVPYPAVLSIGLFSVNNGTDAFFLDSTGDKQDIGVLGTNSDGNSYSIANRINDEGQVVGLSSNGNGNHAFLWSNNVLTDLNNLIPADSGWTLENATDINDTGYIIGSGQINGQTHAFVLAPQSTDNNWIGSAAPINDTGYTVGNSYLNGQTVLL